MLPPTGATAEADVLTAREVLALKRELGDAIATSDSLNDVGWEDLHAGEVERAIVSLELLEPYLSQARSQLEPERIAGLAAAVGTPTLELALELIDGHSL